MAIAALLGFMAKVFEPAVKLVDELNTSEEERLKIKSELFRVQTDMAMQVLQYEQQLLESKTKIIVAEAQGGSWLQRSWRPITMLTFLVLVVLDSFGILANRLAPEAWTLLQIGLGGYVVGRSVEKVMPKLTEVMRKD